MVLVNDKVGSFKVIEPIVTGDAHIDLANLIEQGDAFLWYLDEGLAPLFAELPQHVQADLYRHGKCLWGDWDLFYIPSKIFCISYQHGANYKYYNLSQYFPEIENPGIEIAQRCADELEHSLHLMGIWPKKLSSPAAIFEDYYGKHLDLPTFKDFGMDYSSLMEYAAECAGNEWDELYKIGSFIESFDYDIKSAYGRQMARLLDNRPKYMNIKESADYIADADYGYCKCDMEIYPNIKLHPIMRVDSKGLLSTPTGSWRGYFTKAQLDFVTRWKLGEYEIINGWWLKAHTIVKPLEQIISRLLAFKENDNPEVRFLAKAMVNGFGGKFNEEYKTRVGDLYNPMWSAEIITRNAMLVAETIYKNKCWDNVIQVKVDGFKSDKKLAAIPDGWKETSGECLAATPENVFFCNQHPSGLNLKDAMDLIQEHPGIGYYERRQRKVITLSEAWSNKTPKECGKVKDKITSIDLWRNGVTREFKKLPQSGKELLSNIYQSVPKYIEEV